MKNPSTTLRVKKKKKKFSRSYNIRGIFLIELLVVLAVMIVLAFATYISVYPQVTKAQDAKTKVNLNSVKIAFADYYDDYSCFPTELPACGTDLRVNNKIYIKKFPCGSNYMPFTYETNNTTCPNWYKITTNLKNTQDQSIDAVHCRKGCGPECQFNYGVSDNIRLNYGCPLIYPTPSIIPSATTVPSPTGPVLLFACSPSGKCIRYSYPELSECPKIYVEDINCMNECQDRDNRCKNEKGKRPADQ